MTPNQTQTLANISANPTNFAAAHAAGFEFGQNQSEVIVISGEDGQEDGIPFALIGGNAVSLKNFMPPRHGKMSPEFHDPASFIAYLNRFKQVPPAATGETDAAAGISDSLVFAEFERTGGKFTAILDYPAAGQVSRKEHLATFDVQPTEAWNDWLAIDKEKQSQDSFCEFIEKYRGIFVDPMGTQMLEIARYIEGSKQGKFTFGKRLQTGDREIIWQEDTAITAGATTGEATPIPEQVEISIAMFEGTDPVTVKAWLRVYVQHGTVAFKFETQNLDNTVRASLNAVRVQIRDQTNLVVLLGSPGVNAAA